MPSDQLVAEALVALEGTAEAYRSAVAATAEELRAILRSRSNGSGDTSVRWRAELGPFADRRIDPARLASLFSPSESMDPSVLAVVEKGLGVMEELAGQTTDALFHLRVPAGEDLRDEIFARYAELGRAFGAAEAVTLARRNRYRAEEHERLFSRYPFRRWNRAERGSAPPLVVEVDGADLRAGGLSELLDGTVRIVLVVTGPAPPAALARLVTPGVRVAQARHASVVRALAESGGPAVAALYGEGTGAVVLFEHDPEGGSASSERLTIHDWAGLDAGEEPRWPSRTWGEELAQLRALTAARSEMTGAGTGPAPNGGGAESASEADADRLAAFLLARSRVGAE